MKIAIIYPIDIENKKSGGVETCIRDFVKYSPASWDIKIIGIISGEGMQIGQWQEVIFQSRKIQFFPVLLEKNPNRRSIVPLVLRFTRKLLKYRKWLDLDGYDLHFHRIEPFFVLRAAGCRKRLFVHGDIRDLANRMSENKWKSIIPLYFFLESLFMRHMSRIFVVSQEGCEFYKKKYPDIAERFTFLPTWFDAGVFKVLPGVSRAQTLGSLGITCRGPLFISVSRLEAQKDPFLLIDSFRLIHAQVPASCLLVAGDGNLKHALLKNIEKNGLKDAVHLLGNKQRSQIAELLNISDVFLLTSAFEGMPRVVNEALSCGTPVTVTNAGESRLVVRKGINGAIVAGRDPADIAQAAIKVLNRKFDRRNVSESVQDYRYDKILGSLYAMISKEHGKKIAIIYPIDMENKKSGGVETCIRDFVKYAPPSWEIKMIGISSDPAVKPGKWREIVFQGRNLFFLPLFVEKEPNKRAPVPLVLRFSFALFKYRRNINLKNYDLHFHRIEPFISVASQGQKKCLFVHGDIRDLNNPNSENKWKWLIWIYYLLESRYIKKMSRIFVVSQSGRDFYRNKYPDIAERFAFLPTWFDDGIFKILAGIRKSEVLGPLETTCEKPIFISVSRLEAQKDPVLLLNAYKIIHSQLPQSCLLIAGDGGLRPVLIEIIAKNGLEKSVHLLGNCSRLEIAKLLNIADVFLLTSAFEGMPIVVLEALSCGTAVTVTDAGESRLMVVEGINGSIVHTRNAHDIASKAVEVSGRGFDRAAVAASVQQYRKDKVLGELYAELDRM